MDKQLARIPTNPHGSCCYFADQKTMQLRPVLTYDLAKKTGSASKIPEARLPASSTQSVDT